MSYAMYYGWRVVAGAFVGMMMGTGFFTYAFSLLVNPIREEFGVGLEQVMYSLTIGVMLGLVMGPVSGALVDRHSVRALMSAGAGLGALGFLLMAESTSILMFTISTGLTMSVVMGLTGAMPGSAAVTRWFSANRGPALGIAAMGTSVGGMLYPALIAWWVEAFGWRTALHIMSLSTLLIILPLIWFNVRNHPADLGLTAEGEESSLMPGAGDTGESGGFGELLRNPAFWLLGMSMGLVFSAFSSMLANLSPYATQLGVGEAGISAMIGLLAACGLVGKFTFGMLADRIQLRQGLWIAHALLLAAFAILIAEPPYALMLVAAVFFGLCTGGFLPVWNALVAKLFGIARFGRAMGAMTPVITLMILPGYTIVGRLFDMTGSYTAGLILYSGIILVASTLLLFIRVPESSQ